GIFIPQKIISKIEKDIKKPGFLKRVLGVFLIFIGFLALITPLTPGSWLIFVGLEFIGLSAFVRGKKENK
ncbi:hypothetical protein CO152_00690, partial [bacterium CG_4_9_14_3_um_filter_33_26]